MLSYVKILFDVLDVDPSPTNLVIVREVWLATKLKQPTIQNGVGSFVGVLSLAFMNVDMLSFIGKFCMGLLVVCQVLHNKFRQEAHNHPQQNRLPMILKRLPFTSMSKKERETIREGLGDALLTFSLMIIYNFCRILGPRSTQCWHREQQALRVRWSVYKVIVIYSYIMFTRFTLLSC